MRLLIPWAYLQYGFWTGKQNDFSIINIGIHECDDCYAFFVVFLGMGIRIQLNKANISFKDEWNKAKNEMERKYTKL